jgi:VanZ family protein
MPDKPSSTGDRMALLIIAAVIAYGSLYPFRYHDPIAPIEALYYLLSTWRAWDRRGDLLANILLYAPFGFFAVRAMPGRVSLAARVPLALLAGIGLSATMELSQFHIAGRVTSMGDVYANGIGAMLGAAGGALLRSPWNVPLLKDMSANPIPTMLIAGWLGYRLFPYVPTVDLHKYWHAVRPLLFSDTITGFDLLRFTLIWLLMACLTEVIAGARRWALLFSVLAAVEIMGRIVIVHATLKLADIVGAVIAWSLWLLSHLIPGRLKLLAAAFLGLVVAHRLEPFTFAPATRAYGWVPFRGMIFGSNSVALQSFCEKFVLFGALIWLLQQAGLGLKPATLLTATILFATSLAQLYLPGRSAEITDAVMAALIGYVFGLLSAAPATTDFTPAGRVPPIASDSQNEA